MTSSSRARISTSLRSRLATSSSSSSSCFSAVFSRSAPAIRWLSPPGSSRLATASCSSSGGRAPARRSRLNVCWTLRLSAVSSGDSSTTSGSSEISATRYGVSRSRRRCARAGAPWTRIRSVPSGTFIIRATTPTTPTRRGASGPASPARGRAGDHHEHAVAAEHVVDELDRRSWPTASGVSVSGNGTVSRSGSTGSEAGSAPARRSRRPRPLADDVDVDHGRRSISIGTERRRGCRRHERQLDAQDAVA